MSSAAVYTTQLSAGLGALSDTRALLELWKPGMSAAALNEAARTSGRFARRSARRLRNLVVDCFARRFLVRDGAPAQLLKTLGPRLGARDADQLAFVYACRANRALADFVIDVYWPRYTAGQDRLSNQEARDFVVRANREGKMPRPWSESTVRRVAGYLTGACADFGLLERGPRRTRKVLPWRLEPGAAAALAYDLRFAGNGDNALVAAPDWRLFGLDQHDVLAELKRLALRGLLIVQSAHGIARVSWKCDSLQELANVLAQG